MLETTKYTRGIGYFETIFSVVELSTMAEALKQFALQGDITTTDEPGEVLNAFVASLVQTADFEDFQTVATQLFSFPKNYQGSLEVKQVQPSKKEWQYLQENIKQLLQVQPEKEGGLNG